VVWICVFIFLVRWCALKDVEWNKIAAAHDVMSDWSNNHGRTKWKENKRPGIKQTKARTASFTSIPINKMCNFVCWTHVPAVAFSNPLRAARGWGLITWQGACVLIKQSDGNKIISSKVAGLWAQGAFFSTHVARWWFSCILKRGANYRVHRGWVNLIWCQNSHLFSWPECAALPCCAII
jgi:hypothetical protein